MGAFQSQDMARLGPLVAALQSSLQISSPAQDRREAPPDTDCAKDLTSDLSRWQGSGICPCSTMAVKQKAVKQQHHEALERTGGIGRSAGCQ